MVGTTLDLVVTHFARRMCVLMLLANGYSSKEIAGQLFATKKIVDNDVLWWQNRLGARSRTQVAALAVDIGVLTSRDLRFDGTASALAAFIALQIDDPVKRLERSLHKNSLEKLRTVREH